MVKNAISRRCSRSRSAICFLKAGGVPALAQLLTSYPTTPQVTHYTLAALEALLMSCPAASSEAILGWWRPSPDQPIAEEDFDQDDEDVEEDTNFYEVYLECCDKLPDLPCGQDNSSDRAVSLHVVLLE